MENILDLAGVETKPAEIVPMSQYDFQVTFDNAVQVFEDLKLVSEVEEAILTSENTELIAYHLGRLGVTEEDGSPLTVETIAANKDSYLEKIKIIKSKAEAQAVATFGSLSTTYKNMVGGSIKCLEELKESIQKGEVVNVEKIVEGDQEVINSKLGFFIAAGMDITDIEAIIKLIQAPGVIAKTVIPENSKFIDVLYNDITTKSEPVAAVVPIVPPAPVVPEVIPPVVDGVPAPVVTVENADDGVPPVPATDTVVTVPVKLELSTAPTSVLFIETIKAVKEEAAIEGVAILSGMPLKVFSKNLSYVTVTMVDGKLKINSSTIPSKPIEVTPISLENAVKLIDAAIVEIGSNQKSIDELINVTKTMLPKFVNSDALIVAISKKDGEEGAVKYDKLYSLARYLFDTTRNLSQDFIEISTFVQKLVIASTTKKKEEV